jgi:hypothetical protein
MYYKFCVNLADWNVLTDTKYSTSNAEYKQSGSDSNDSDQ